MRRPLLALCLLGAGCIPSRDNPHDPAVRPSATLRVVDIGALSDDACRAAVVSGTALVPVVVVSRGRCLALDAREPDGSASGGASYRFLVPGVADPIEPDGPALVLDPDDRRGLPIGEVVDFSVEVRGGGGTSTATAPVVLTNEKPVAIVPPPRIVPSNGFPWAPGAPMPITFDGSQSFDPDGDPLFFTWELPDGSVSDQPLVNVTIAPGSGDAHASLVVRDGEDAPDGSRVRASRRATSLVHVSDRPPLYGQAVGLFGGAGAAQRFDTEPALVIDSASKIVRAVDLPPVPGDPVARIAYVRLSSDTELVLADAATGAVTDTIVHDSSSALHVDPLTRKLWVVHGDGGADTAQVFDPTNGDLVLEASFNLPGFALAAASIAALPDGRALLSDGSSVFRVAPFAQTATVVASPVAGERVLPLARRPGLDEVWELRGSVNVAADVDAALVVRAFDGAELRRIELGAIQPTTFAWIDRDDLWLVVAGDGVRRVDAALLEEGASLESATLVRVPFPSVNILTTAFGGPSSALWVSAPGEVLEAFLDGSHRRFDEALARPQLVDSDGALWFGTDAPFGPVGLTRVSTLDPAGRITDNVMNGVNVPSVDASSGLAWFTSGIPFGLVLMGPDGQIARYEPEVFLDGVLAPAPPLAAFSVAPDGRSAWGGAFVYDSGLGETVTSAIYRFDLAADPPAVTTVLARPESDPFDLFTVQPTTPSGPADSVWMIARSGGQYRAGLLDPTGTFTERYAVPAAAVDSPPPTVARSLRTDAVCLLWMEPGATMHLRRVEADGDVTVLFDGVAVSGIGVTAAAVSDDGAGGDLCWVVLESTDTCEETDVSILGWTTAGGPATATTIVDAGDAISLVALSADELWLTHGCETTQHSRTQLLHSGAGWTTRDLPISQPTLLVGPERGLP